MYHTGKCTEPLEIKLYLDIFGYLKYFLVQITPAVDYAAGAIISKERVIMELLDRF